MWRNFFFMFIVFGLSLGILYTTIFELDPLGSQRILAFMALFFSIFFLILSFFSFIFFFGAEIFSGFKLGNRSFLIAVRRSGLLGFFIISVVALQLFKLLGLEEVFLLLIFFGLIEWIFLTSKYY